MRTLYEFDTLEEAREYRHEHGTGGWIFEPEHGGCCVLFPPDMYPMNIMIHPITYHRSGKLIG